MCDFFFFPYSPALGTFTDLEVLFFKGIVHPAVRFKWSSYWWLLAFQLWMYGGMLNHWLLMFLRGSSAKISATKYQFCQPATAMRASDSCYWIYFYFFYNPEFRWITEMPFLCHNGCRRGKPGNSAKDCLLLESTRDKMRKWGIST